LDHGLHRLVHLLCETKDLFLLTLEWARPDRIRDNPFKGITRLLATTRNDHDGSLVHDGKEGRRRGGPCLSSKEIYPYPFPGALVRKDANGLPLLKGLLQGKECVLLGNNDLAAVCAVAVNQSLEVFILHGPNHDDEWNPNKGTDIR